VGEDLLNDGRVIDRGDALHPAGTTRTAPDVQIEGPAHEGRPAPIAWSVGASAPRPGGCHARIRRAAAVRAVIGDDLWPPATIETPLGDTTQSGAWDAEFYRLKGELWLASDSTVDAEAEGAFRHAIDIARQQHAKSWELRAVMHLSALWHRQKKHAEAHRLLEEAQSWFTESHDTSDLRDARAFLDEIRRG